MQFEWSAACKFIEMTFGFKLNMASKIKMKYIFNLEVPTYLCRRCVRKYGSSETQIRFEPEIIVGKMKYEMQMSNAVGYWILC